MPAAAMPNQSADRSRRGPDLTTTLVSLLPALRACSEPHRFLRRAEQRLRLVDAFAVLVGRIGIVDDSGAGLDMHEAVFHHRGAEHDAGVHFAASAEIADAAGVDAPLVLLEFVDDLHRAHFGRA